MYCHTIINFGMYPALRHGKRGHVKYNYGETIFKNSASGLYETSSDLKLCAY